MDDTVRVHMVLIPDQPFERCRGVGRVGRETGEVTELLQQLIRNACVNDGTAESGHEERSADLLADYLAGGTDAGYFRQRGSVAYGCGLMSPGVTYEALANRFHGNDERIDVESLRLTTDLWLGVAREFLAPAG